jgi:hypothetical protein
MSWIIKDTDTGEYFRQRCGPSGWYSNDINHARLYSLERMAQQTIAADEHHVSYPGNRNLAVKQVQLVEL